MVVRDQCPVVKDVDGWKVVAAHHLNLPRVLEENWKVTTLRGINGRFHGRETGRTRPKCQGLCHCQQSGAGHVSEAMGPGLLPGGEGSGGGRDAGTLREGIGAGRRESWHLQGWKGPCPGHRGRTLPRPRAAGGRRGPEHQAPPQDRGGEGAAGEGGEAAPELGHRGAAPAASLAAERGGRKQNIKTHHKGKKEKEKKTIRRKEN